MPAPPDPSPHGPRAGVLVQWGLGGLLALAVVVGLQWYVGWSRLLGPWLALDGTVLLLAVGLVAVGYLARAARLHVLFVSRTAGRARLCVKLILLNTLANNLVPMRAGELSFPLLMRRFFGVPMGTATAGLAWLRLMDLHTLLGLGLVGILPGWLGGGLTWLTVAAWLVLPWLLYRFQRDLLRRLAGGRGGRLAGAVAAGLPADPFTFWQCWIWTVLAWLAKLSVFVWLLIAFSAAPVEAALAGAVGGELTSVLPFHGVAGLGTYEAGVVAGMTPWGVALKAAVTAAVNLHLFLLGISVAGGALALLIREERYRG